MSKPLLAIVGRPNVGKSTLFNKIVGKRISIAHNTPGVTRDRIYADASWLDYHFTVIDTGGIEYKSEDEMWRHIRSQAETAIEIADCIIGIGLNVNQQQFVSDAPNPISMFQIISRETDRHEVLNSILQHFETIETDILPIYKSLLYRRNGFYRYRDSNGEMEAEIIDVATNGLLSLRDRDQVDKMCRSLRNVPGILDAYRSRA